MIAAAVTKPRIDFIELPCAELDRVSGFYARAFGWDFTAFGQSYACTMTGDVDLGLQADRAEASRAPLPVVHVADLDEALAAVSAGGGTIVRPIFSFPGGRRFHFRDPAGNELAAYQPDEAEA